MSPAKHPNPVWATRRSPHTEVALAKLPCISFDDMSPTDSTDKPTKHNWNTASATLFTHLLLNEPWVLDLDSRFLSLVQTGTVPSKDRIVVSTPRQARELLNRSAAIYSWEDPAPIAIPTRAQLLALDALPIWALGAGGGR